MNAREFYEKEWAITASKLKDKLGEHLFTRLCKISNSYAQEREKQAVTADRERIRAGIEALINELYDRDDISYETWCRKHQMLDATIAVVDGGDDESN